MDAGEAAAAARPRADAPDLRVRRLERGADLIAELIGARRGIRIERHAVQRVEREDGGVDDERRRAVHAEGEIFLVFVLGAERRAAAARDGGRRQHEGEQGRAHA
jgi:hypothetical protein